MDGSANVFSDHSGVKNTSMLALLLGKNHVATKIHALKKKQCS
jgi:hypothetical protein